jgi:hypothetical protein
MRQVVMVKPDSRAVRAWAVENGYAIPGRGRLSVDAVAAFNRAHGMWGARAYSGNDRVRRHTVKPPVGRSITRSYRVSEARAWAVGQGLSMPGQRGRLSSTVLDAYVLALVGAA